MDRTRQDLTNLVKEVMRLFPEPIVQLFRQWKVGFAVGSDATLAVPAGAVGTYQDVPGYPVVEDDGSVCVRLSKDVLSWPEEVTKYVLAHELAHIALFHFHWGMSSADLYSDGEMEHMRRIFEEHADWFVIHICGLEAEAKRASQVIGPNSRQLAWLWKGEQKGGDER